MKKFLVAAMLVFTFGFQSFAEASVSDKLLFYLPNRILDVMDIFTLNLGFGPTARLELQATRACGLGAGVGASYKLFKAWNRQYGYGRQVGWDAAFTCMYAENIDVDDTSRLVHHYWESFSGVPVPTTSMYNYFTGWRDYWAFGGSAGVIIVEADFYIHPVEIADLITGFLFMDIRNDDITSEDFE